MPNIKLAKKRVKVIATKTFQNKAINFASKTEIKKVSLAFEAQAEDETEATCIAIKRID